MDERRLVEALAGLEPRGMEVVGFYHCTPTATRSPRPPMSGRRPIPIRPT
ncbi:MAG: hypothetical protein U0703_03330 [Anaerolineae bacterium]